MRRFSAAASLLLLGVIAISVAEASLLGLLVLFTFILRLKFGVELGPAGFLFAQPDCCPPQLTLFNATTVGSFLLTAAAGLATAAWKFRRWRPLA